MLKNKNYAQRDDKNFLSVLTGKERFLNDGQTIICKTDLNGVIIAVNEAFEQVSGFFKEELLGKSQSIIHHLVVSKASVFESGCVFKGIMPGRCVAKKPTKDGGFYWVEERISPIFENGVQVGFLSVQSRPDKSDIQRIRYSKINLKLQRRNKRESVTIAQLSVK